MGCVHVAHPPAPRVAPRATGSQAACGCPLVNTTAGPEMPESRKTLLAHALELHEHDPDGPLPRDGEPFPDHVDSDPDNCPAMTRRSRTGFEAVGITEEDVGLVQTIGLLPNHFGPRAARALAKLPSGSAQALLWPADRVAGWGRVNVMRSLAGLDDPDVRRWLLRKAIDGDILDGYFAAVVVMTGRLHEVLDELAADPELTDCTGRILWIMKRYYIAAVLERNLGRSSPDDPDRAAYRALLDDPGWREVALAGLAEGDRRIRIIADRVAPEIGLALGREE